MKKKINRIIGWGILVIITILLIELLTLAIGSDILVALLVAGFFLSIIYLMDRAIKFLAR